MANKSTGAYRRAISASALSIYDPIQIGDPDLWIPSPTLETMLDDALRGLSLSGLPLRTRSKVLKTRVCSVIGYPIPRSFRKTQPRFPGQNFDTYIQKSNNLQIWNEELSPSRRYVLIRVSDADQIQKVKVVTGDELAKLDTTGTLTRKYQARLIAGAQHVELIAEKDSDRVAPFVSDGVQEAVRNASPIADPTPGRLLSIRTLFDALSRLVGKVLTDPGILQERNRAEAMHREVCVALGYSIYADSGQFPDVRHQLLEVKLQTSRTIDLGLVTPNSQEPLDVPHLVAGTPIRHCDVRYAIFYGITDGAKVKITHLFVTTGERFFDRFPQFQGLVINAKLQIPLPRDFWSREIKGFMNQNVRG
ncbi:MAG: restriction endonuclease [Gammaproteobacteria bacterium]